MAWSLPVYGMAAYVGASRLHDNRHWLSDVVFGAAVGAIAGRTIARHGRSNFAWAPVYMPGRGVAVLIARVNDRQDAPAGRDARGRKVDQPTRGNTGSPGWLRNDERDARLIGLGIGLGVGVGVGLAVAQSFENEGYLGYCGLG